MAAKRSKVDTSKMTPEEREAYEKRREAARAPKPAYLVYNVVDGEGNTIPNATITVGEVTRSAEEALTVIDGDKSLKYARILLK